MNSSSFEYNSESDGACQGGPRAQRRGFEHQNGFKAGEARQSDDNGPSREYLEARDLFEKACDGWGIVPEDRFVFGEPLTRSQTAQLTRTDKFAGWGPFGSNLSL